MKNKPEKTDNFQGIIELSERFPDEKTCREYFTAMRWNGKPVCPHCANSEKKIYVFKARNLYRCTACTKQFTVTVGTVFEGSKVPLRKWMYAIYLLTNTSKGVSSVQLAEMLKLTQKTAWFVMHRIRYAIKTKNFWTAPLSNIVEADETLIGGKERNKHSKKRLGGTQGRSSKGKVTVVGILERGGNVMAQSVTDSSSQSLHPMVIENVTQGSTLMTDEWRGYNGLRYIYNHKRVNHSAGEYVVGDAHTNTIEGFWSLMKRGVIGVYHYISPKHCDKYMDEYAFRYNMRKANDKARIDLMLNNCNGRLKYSTLIAK